MTLIGKFGLITIFIVFDVAGLPETHVKEDVTTHEIMSPLFIELLEYVGLLEPTVIPLAFQTNVGVPPLVGVAVKVTLVPSHTSLRSADIFTLTGRFSFTVNVAGAEVTVGEQVPLTTHLYKYPSLTNIVLDTESRFVFQFV